MATEQALLDRLAAAIDSPEKFAVAVMALTTAAPLCAPNLDEENPFHQQLAVALLSEEFNETVDEVLHILFVGYLGNVVLRAMQTSGAAKLPIKEDQFDPLWEKLRRMALVALPDTQGEGEQQGQQVTVSDSAHI